MSDSLDLCPRVILCNLLSPSKTPAGPLHHYHTVAIKPTVIKGDQAVIASVNQLNQHL